MSLEFGREDQEDLAEIRRAEARMKTGATMMKIFDDFEKDLEEISPEINLQSVFSIYETDGEETHLLEDISDEIKAFTRLYGNTWFEEIFFPEFSSAREKIEDVGVKWHTDPRYIALSQILEIWTGTALNRLQEKVQQELAISARLAEAAIKTEKALRSSIELFYREEMTPLIRYLTEKLAEKIAPLTARTKYDYLNEETFTRFSNLRDDASIALRNNVSIFDERQTPEE